VVVVVGGEVQVHHLCLTKKYWHTHKNSRAKIHTPHPPHSRKFSTLIKISTQEDNKS
jgi:hypothetical protein